MAGLLAFSQSSLLLLTRPQLRSSRHHLLITNFSHASLSTTTPISCMLPISRVGRNQFSYRTVAGVVSDSKVPPTTFTVDSAGEGIEVLPDSGGSDNIGGSTGDSGGSGGGGGGGGGGNDGNDSGESEDQSGDHEKKGGMSMSQKLTLGYAALVGIGGAMGYLKGGSQKSLIAGGVSASVLYYVYTLLPSNPVMASSVGLVLSAALLGVMGSRFKRSGKIFPAGVVSLASLVMTGGYLHGILRSLH